MESKSRIALLFLGFLMLLSCNGPEVIRPITIAIPIGSYSTLAAIEHFQEILVRDHKHMVRDSHIEGMPTQTMVVQLDAAKLDAVGLNQPNSKAKIVAEFPKSMPWTADADSLLFTATPNGKRDNLNVEDMERLVIGQPGPETVVFLKDVAVIRLEEKIVPIVVQGKDCIVIEGTTNRSDEEVQNWFRGLDQQLGLEFFIIFGDSSAGK